MITDKDLLELARKAGFLTGEIHYPSHSSPFVKAISDTNFMIELKRFSQLLMKERND